MAKQMHKIGIIGCGGIANGKHMPSLKQIDNVEMVAFCDIIRERIWYSGCKSLYGLQRTPGRQRH